jgi:hypothetical protein
LWKNQNIQECYKFSSTNKKNDIGLTQIKIVSGRSWENDDKFNFLYIKFEMTIYDRQF